MISDQGQVIAHQENTLAVADSAAEAIANTLTYLSEFIRGGHAAITGAAIRRNDPLNSDVSAATIAASPVGLVDLNY